jgi:ketosteroid isomerase-like protein
MGLIENKQVVQTFLDAGAKGDIQTCFSQLAEDVAWTNIGQTKYSGTFSGKADLTSRLIGPLFAQLVGDIRSTVHNVIAEGDLVVVQSTGQATTGSTIRTMAAFNCYGINLRDHSFNAANGLSRSRARAMGRSKSWDR